MNGLMIDCCRLMERHEYYVRLIDFMAQWGMDTLVLHFSDDHGLAIELRGFEEIAMPHAFTRDEIRQLVAHAARKGIEIIPELETFGHTRYLTNHPTYAGLSASEAKKDVVELNSVDPLNPETHRVMKKLIAATAELFTSDHLHVGCDEVNLAAFCRERGLNPQQTWAEYVNRIFSYCRDAGKRPMFWADHPEKDSGISQRLDKDAVAVRWNYEPNVSAAGLRNLKQAGFSQVITAPALAWYEARFLPVDSVLENVRRSIQLAARQRAGGVLTTIWCPYRYIQGTMYYGVAYAAERVRNGGVLRRDAFHRRFAREVFGTRLQYPLRQFLDLWTRLDLPRVFFEKQLESEWRLDRAVEKRVHDVRLTAKTVLEAAKSYKPKENQDIWAAMKLAAECVWLCAEAYELEKRQGGAKRITHYNQMLVRVKQALSDQWDQTRYADDPAKTTARYTNEESSFAHLAVGRLKEI